MDDNLLDVDAMLDAMEADAEAARTSRPSPQGWLAQFDRADKSIAITISSRLSGSFNSALVAQGLAQASHPEKQVAVLDSGSTGPALALCAERVRERIREGLPFERVVEDAREALGRTHIVFALSSFGNLVKAGRVGRVTGLVASKLNVWGVGVGTDGGTIALRDKVRGAKKALRSIVEDMAERGFCGGRVAISQCHNGDLARELQLMIYDRWPGSSVRLLPTRGLCSFYAERGGIIVGFEGAR